MDPTQVAEAATTEAEDLSDEQIEALLQQAEERLRKQAGQSSTTKQSRLIPKAQQLELSPAMKPYIKETGEVATADPQRLVDDKTKSLSSKIRKVEDPVALKRKNIEEKKATAGGDWFNLPRTKLTPELKRDLQLLRMRSILDPKRFYKKENTRAKPPEFSHVTTLIEGPTDFYSARIPKKERKQTLVEEVLAGERETGKFRKKYLELQAAKRSGRKGQYNERMKKKYKNKMRR